MKPNEELVNRIREAITESGEIEEKEMFSGLCFILNNKMCICLGADEMMYRVDPDEYENALEKPNTRPMVHCKPLNGHVFVNMESLKAKRDFDYWIKASLAFNKLAKPSKPGKKK